MDLRAGVIPTERVGPHAIECRTTLDTRREFLRVSATYVLDTSVFRSVRPAVIDAAHAQGWQLFVSPLSVWEMMCHVAGDNFARAKSWFAKASQCSVLEHPMVEHAKEIRAEHLVCDAAWEERPCAQAAIDAVCAASVEGNLDKAVFRLVGRSGDRELRALGGAPSRVHVELERLENEHVAFVSDYIVCRPDLASIPTDSEYMSLIESDIRHKYEDARVHGLSRKNLFRRLFRSLYPVASYNLERGFRSRIAGANLDKNDYEDSLIVAHLRLGNDRVLVTSDKGTLKAMAEASIRVAAWGATPLRSQRRVPLAISTEEFVQLLAAA